MVHSIIMICIKKISTHKIVKRRQKLINYKTSAKKIRRTRFPIIWRQIAAIFDFFWRRNKATSGGPTRKDVRSKGRSFHVIPNNYSQRKK